MLSGQDFVYGILSRVIFFFFCRLLRPWLLKIIYLLGQTYLVWQTHYNTKNTHSILLFSTTISNIFQKQSSRGKYLSEKSGYILRNSDSNMFQKWQRKNHEEKCCWVTFLFHKDVTTIDRYLRQTIIIDLLIIISRTTTCSSLSPETRIW